jgi:hypothetical protein
VRRGRRFWFGTDVSPCQRGLRKMVSLRRHGGSGGASDRSCRFMPRTARRACLCGTQGGWVWRMRRHRPPGWKQSGKAEPPFRPPSPSSAVADAETEMPIPETGGQHPPDPAFAEGPGSRAKTAERGAERCHHKHFSRGSFSAPSEGSLKPHGREIRCVAAGVAGKGNERPETGGRHVTSGGRSPPCARAVRRGCRRRGRRSRASCRGSMPWRR